MGGVKAILPFHFVSFLSPPSPRFSLTRTLHDPNTTFFPQKFCFLGLLWYVFIVKGFSVQIWFDQQGFNGARVCCHRCRWVRTVKRSKLRVCRLSVFFSQTRSSLERFRLFCFNSWPAYSYVELWVPRRHRYRWSRSGKMEPGRVFCW